MGKIILYKGAFHYMGKWAPSFFLNSRRKFYTRALFSRREFKHSLYTFAGNKMMWRKVYAVQHRKDNNYQWKFILLHTANYIWNFQANHPCYMYAHAFLSMCITIPMVNIWVLSANWLGFQSNALWFFWCKCIVICMHFAIMFLLTIFFFFQR